MPFETYSLERFDAMRTQVEAAFRAHRTVFIEVPREDFGRIAEAIDLDRNSPNGIVARIKTLLRIPRVARGHVGTFWVIYMFAKKHRMIVRAEHVDGKPGFLFLAR
jgi:hypothetical protein